MEEEPRSVHGRVCFVNHKENGKLITIENEKDQIAYTFESEYTSRAKVGDLILLNIVKSEMSFKPYYHEPFNGSNHLAWKHMFLIGKKHAHNLGPYEFIGPLIEVKRQLDSIFNEKINILSLKSDLNRLNKALEHASRKTKVILDE